MVGEGDESVWNRLESDKKGALSLWRAETEKLKK
jgi:hypothetical protein